jgi:hypothetical protein
MTDLMAHHLGDFVVAGIQLLDQAGVDRHASAGHAPGVDRLRIVDDMHAPLPLLGFRPVLDRLRHQLLGDADHACARRRIVVELALFVDRLEHRDIGFLRSGDRGVFRHQHQLGTTADRVGLAAAEGQQRDEDYQ